jgi:phenylalanyl-tRNA synthetase beta chain
LAACSPIPEHGQPGAKEDRRVAIAITGQRALPFWSGSERDAKFDIYDLKGPGRGICWSSSVCAAWLSASKPTARRCSWNPPVTLGGKLPLGELGQLLPTLAKKYDLRDAVFLAEFNLDCCCRNGIRPSRSSRCRNFPQPPRRGDARAGGRDARSRAANRQAGQSRESGKRGVVRRVPGQGVPPGQKSLAYAFTYRAADKTLTDAEVNTAHAKVLEALKTQLQAEMRA